MDRLQGDWDAQVSHSADSVIDTLEVAAIMLGGGVVTQGGKQIVKEGVDQAAVGWTAISRDARAVIRDVESHSGLIMPKNQRALLANELRDVDHTYVTPRVDYQSLQREYANKRNNLKREWELNTGQTWPKTATGVDYQAHHVIPQQYGGPNQCWNLHPVPGGNAHQGGVHGIGSPTSNAFPQHPPRVQ